MKTATPTLLATVEEARTLAQSPATTAKFAGLKVRIYAVRTLKGETRYLVSGATPAHLNTMVRNRVINGVSMVLSEVDALEAPKTDAAELERVRQERAYDRLHNEGADGYNPHRLPKPAVRLSAEERATWEACNRGAIDRALRGED